MIQTWTVETEPEKPQASVDITPQWNDVLYAKMNNKNYHNLLIPTGGLYTHAKIFKASLQLVIAQSSDQFKNDCSKHVILN